MFRLGQSQERSTPDPTNAETGSRSGRTSWRVLHRSDGTSQVEVDGADVTNGLSAANLRLGSRGEPAELTLETVGLHDVEVFGESSPIWVGLERVPDAGLIAELQARGYTVRPTP